MVLETKLKMRKVYRQKDIYGIFSRETFCMGIGIQSMLISKDAPALPKYRGICIVLHLICTNHERF